MATEEPEQSTSVSRSPSAPLAEETTTQVEESPSAEVETSTTAPDDANEESKEKQDSKVDDTESWQAVFSPEANAWYFWNSKTNETTWTNPREKPTASTSTSTSTDDPSTSSTSNALDSQPSTTSSTSRTDTLPPIDPDLAWLDPSASRGGAVGGAVQAARFNARTGRFQVDSKLTPDRISDFKRGQRQQEAYYDVAGWEAQLEGKGLKRAAEGGEEVDGSDGSGRKRPSTKQVEQFRKQKEEKKKKKLTSWLTT